MDNLTGVSCSESHAFFVLSDNLFCTRKETTKYYFYVKFQQNLFLTQFLIFAKYILKSTLIGVNVSEQLLDHMDSSRHQLFSRVKQVRSVRF